MVPIVEIEYVAETRYDDLAEIQHTDLCARSLRRSRKDMNSIFTLSSWE